jgi:ketosteroid isomerase-like protein
MKSHSMWLQAGALLILALPFSFMAGYQITAETPESVLQAVIRANSEKDLATLEKHVAKDPDLLVYTVGGRKYVGWNDVAKAMQEEFDMADRLDVTITDIHVWQRGDVAWFAMELNYNRLEGNGQGQKSMVLPLRDTGVLERRNGRWLLVSLHESLQAAAVEAETVSDSTAGTVGNGMDLSGEWQVQEEDKTYRAHLDVGGNGTYTWQGGQITTTGLAGVRWMGTWQQPGNDREGKFEIVLSPNGTHASGRWWYTRIGTRTNIPPGHGGNYHWKRVSPVPAQRQASR